VVTTAGILVISRYAHWAARHVIYFKSFAAGMLTAISLLHVMPKSLDLDGRAPWFWVLGFLVITLSNYALHASVEVVGSKPASRGNVIPVLVLGFHSLVDGAILAVTFDVNIFTGALTALGMILHEFPEGIVTFVLLNGGGLPTGRARVYAFGVAALSTPVGALLAYPFVHTMERSAAGVLLALSAGALLYAGASHLLPEVQEEGERRGILTLLLGVLIAMTILWLRG
jgi:zinc transporter ZupT